MLLATDFVLFMWIIYLDPRVMRFEIGAVVNSCIKVGLSVQRLHLHHLACWSVFPAGSLMTHYKLPVV